MPTEQLSPRLNGNVETLSVDRAANELRRGRAVLVTGTTSALLASTETASDTLIDALTTISGGPPVLAVTGERMRALGRDAGAQDTVLLPVDPGVGADGVRHLAFGRPDERVLGPVPTRRPDLARIGEAGIGLAKIAKLVPSALVAPTVPDWQPGIAAALDDGSLLRAEMDHILRYTRSVALSLEPAAEARIPLIDSAETRFLVFRGSCGVPDQVAIIVGSIDPGAPVLVRLHSACLTGDLFGSLRCDCGEQLRAAVQAMVEHGHGVLLYLAQEGRGIGLANKMRAYDLQDSGLDTVEADQILGFGADERQYEIAAAMLRQLGIRRIRLMTNNPDKLRALGGEGIEIVDRVPVLGSVNPHNLRYLTAKVERAGHLLGPEFDRPPLDDGG